MSAKTLASKNQICRESLECGKENPICALPHLTKDEYLVHINITDSEPLLLATQQLGSVYYAC